MARGFDDINPNAGNRDNLKIEEIVDIHKFEDGQYESLRILPSPMLPVKMHWIKILAGKEKREVKVPRLCVSFDPDNESTPKEGTDCPYCKLTQGQDGSCQTSKAYYANVIVRDEQENEPRKKGKPTKKEKKTGFKEKGSKTWTPVKVVKLTNGVASKLKQLKQRNNNTSIADGKGGCDVAIMYDSKAAAASAYTIDRGDKSPLTKEEKAYLTWDLSDDVYEMMGLMTQDQAMEDFKRMDVIGNDTIDDDDDDDGDDDYSIGKKKKKSKSKSKDSLKDKKKKSKKKSDDDDEDEKPKKKKKKSSDSDKKSSKKKSKDKDTDVKKKKKKKSDDDEPKKKKKKKSKF